MSRTKQGVMFDHGVRASLGASAAGVQPNYGTGEDDFDYVPDPAQSTFSIPTMLPGDDVPTAWGAVIRNAAGQVIPGATLTLVREDAELPDGSDTTFVRIGSSDIPADGTTQGRFRLIVLDRDGYAMPNIPVARIAVVSSRGGLDTLAFRQPNTNTAATVTDRTGAIDVVLTSSNSGTPSLTATVFGVEVDNNPTITVVAVPGVLVPIWYANFPTTGTSLTARSSNGKFNIVSGGLVVLANPGTLGFPADMATVCQVPWYPFVGSSANRKGGLTAPSAEGILPIPAIGETQYYRFYFRLDQPDPWPSVEESDELQTHPIQDGNAAGTLNYELSVRRDVGTGLFNNEHLLNHSSPASVRVFSSGNLLKEHTYRYEWKVTRTGATTYKMWVRVYDESVSLLTPIITPSDYVQTLPIVGSPPTLESYMAAGDHTYTNVDYTEGLNMGANDGGIPEEPGIYGYQNGFCITRDPVDGDDLWIGPYQPLVELAA